MLNIIKADLYRITRGRGLYITISVFIAFMLLMTFSMGQGSVGMDIDQIENPDQYSEMTLDNGETVLMYDPGVIDINGYLAPFVLASSADNAIWFILPFLVFFITSDFANGAVKNLLSSGFSRAKYYGAKIILMAGVTLALWLLYILIPIVTAAIWRGGFGDKSDEYFLWEVFNIYRPDANFLWEVLKIYLPQLYLMYAVTFIGMFIAFAFRRTAALNTLYIVAMFVPSVVSFIVHNFNKKLGELIMKWSITTNMQMFGYPNGAVPPSLSRSLILGSVVIAACAAGGILLFRRAEIK